MLSDPSFGRAAASLVAVGWVLVAGVVLGCLLGRYLDEKWNTSPGMLLAGAALGLTVGVLYIVRAVRKSSP